MSGAIPPVPPYVFMLCTFADLCCYCAATATRRSLLKLTVPQLLKNLPTSVNPLVHCRVHNSKQLPGRFVSQKRRMRAWRRECRIARSKRVGTRAETRFGLSAKRTSPFKSAGVSVQSTTGSRGVRISGQQLYRPCSDVQCKAAGYPLHSYLSPSLPLPCVTVCHQVLNAIHTP